MLRQDLEQGPQGTLLSLYTSPTSNHTLLGQQKHKFSSSPRGPVHTGSSDAAYSAAGTAGASWVVDTRTSLSTSDWSHECSSCLPPNGTTERPWHSATLGLPSKEPQKRLFMSSSLCRPCHFQGWWERYLAAHIYPYVTVQWQTIRNLWLLWPLLSRLVQSNIPWFPYF